ncbi:DUF6900 domain-containing protein [Paraburkholderia strydomiana]|uniref:DUF6900 domain-containing protein n=1 Tax=Paraburkholderia strydomiana TaxID=1245417 RepID=UPI00285D42F8|nr:hypothetical protein [Paraburkholderia strydomiana]MDR7006175.1 histone H3/H4 [Paraburkholderia strydomiana]
MNTAYEERLNVLSEIAEECFEVNELSSDCSERETRLSVRVSDIVRALESAYDVGLIAGYHLSRQQRTRY